MSDSTNVTQKPKHLSADVAEDVARRHTSSDGMRQYIRHPSRPMSDIVGSGYKSPEAEAIDRWFEDLSYYERTLEQMERTKQDSAFKDELSAVERWFHVLTEPEKTTVMYSMLRGATQVQIRFFLTVLQQLVKVDQIPGAVPLSPKMVSSPNMQNISRPNSSTAVSPSLFPSDALDRSEALHGNGYLSVSSGGYMGPNSAASTTPGGTRRLFDRHSFPADLIGSQSFPISSSMSPSEFYLSPNVPDTMYSAGPQTPQLSATYSWPQSAPLDSTLVTTTAGLNISNDYSRMAAGTEDVNPYPISANIPIPVSHALQMTGSPKIKNDTPRSIGFSPSHSPLMRHQAVSTLIANKLQSPMALSSTIYSSASWDTSSQAVNIPAVLINFSEASDDNFDHESSEARSRSGTGGPLPKAKPQEPMTLEAIQDIPGWLRSLRLHKYTKIFETDDWKQMIELTEDQLIERGVAALGARRKMLKAFESVRNELKESNE